MAVANQTKTLLSLQARTAVAVSADQTNRYHRGVRVHVNVTVDPAAASITVTIQGKDAITGDDYALLAGSAIAATGDTYYVVYPGATVTANVSANLALPPVWRVSVAVADADSLTYGITAELLN